MTACRTCSGIVIRPACVDIILQQGTDATLEVILTDGDGAAVDITNDTVTMTVRESIGGTLLFQKSNGIGEHNEPLRGSTLMVIEPADIPAAGVFVYEVRRLLQAGTERIHISGTLTIEAAI